MLRAVLLNSKNSNRLVTASAGSWNSRLYCNVGEIDYRGNTIGSRLYRAEIGKISRRRKDSKPVTWR